MKRKKVTRYRGSKTHGCGSMKKRRGAGNRGGRGMAGTGKRGDARKPSISRTRYFGKHGFVPKAYTRKIGINVHELTAYGDKVNLKDMGFDKLLGKGRAPKVEVTVASATKKAIDKIEAAGGKVILLEKDVSVENTVDEPA
jgi:large subunit ribosomal protein L15